MPSIVMLLSFNVFMFKNVVPKNINDMSQVMVYLTKASAGSTAVEVINLAY